MIISLDLKKVILLLCALLTQTIEYYINRGSPVFACFVTFSKASDNVNYWKLFKQLLADGVELRLSTFVGLLVYRAAGLC